MALAYARGGEAAKRTWAPGSIAWYPSRSIRVSPTGHVGIIVMPKLSLIAFFLGPIVLGCSASTSSINGAGTDAGPTSDTSPTRDTAGSSDAPTTTSDATSD